MPKSVQGRAKQLIHEMYPAPTRKAALAAHDQFCRGFGSRPAVRTKRLPRRAGPFFAEHILPVIGAKGTKRPSIERNRACCCAALRGSKPQSNPDAPFEKHSQKHGIKTANAAEQEKNDDWQNSMHRSRTYQSNHPI
jgi:hypothetical protein